MIKDDYLKNTFPVAKTVKIPVYSTLRYKDGELVGDIESYIDTPVEWLEGYENKRDVH